MADYIPEHRIKIRIPYEKLALLFDDERQFYIQGCEDIPKDQIKVVHVEGDINRRIASVYLQHPTFAVVPIGSETPEKNIWERQ